MPPLLFTRLSIRRMPGLPRGLRDYQHFAPHINIVIGPNASGKSSTARAIRELIWRQATGDLTANALVEVDGQEWELKLDGHRASARRNGQEDTLTGVPAWEGHKRYTLALHDLVAADDADLARQVIRDSVGYDLDAAQLTLGYAAGANSPRTTVYREFKVAKDAYDERFRSQDDLNREQGRLARLIQDKTSAEQAGALLEWNRQLLEFLQAKQTLANAQSALAAFPTVLERLSGSEYEDLEGLRRQLGTLETQVENLNEEIADAEGRRSALNFPDGGLPPTLLRVLDDKIATLVELERELTEKQREIADAVAREKAALKRLGADQRVSDWDGVTWRDVEELETYLQKVHQLLSRKGAIEALIGELNGSAGTKEHPSPASLLTAIDALTGWLRDFKPEEKASVPAWSLWVIAVLAIVPVISVLLFGNIGLLGVLVVFAVAAMIRFSRKTGGESFGVVRRSDYQRVGLPEPSEWSLAPVQKRLTELVEQLGEAKWQQQVTDRIEIHQGELNRMSPELKAMEDEYDLLKERLKLIPAGPAGDLRSFDGMYVFLRYAGEWHACYSERMGLENTFRTMEEQRDIELSDINSKFLSANPGPVDDATTAREVLRHLIDDDRSWGTEGATIANAHKGIAERKPIEEQVIEKVNEIYANCEVEGEDDRIISELVAKVEEYQTRKQALRDAATLLTEKERVLRGNALFSSRRAEIEHVDLATVEATMPVLRAEAGRLEQLTSDIGGINARIAEAGAGNSLEVALKAKEDRLADLEEMYDTNLAAATGKLLIDALKKQADDRDRPAVFRRANSIFRLITNGKFELRLRSSDSPAFGAFDTVEGEWRELKELSTGTRIQLLLSVRIAFIDSIESSVRIPIVADELLANSDSLRAAAIVNALAEISREGRQVFYFTSQEEEVAKWREFLADKPDITREFYVLGGQNNEGYELAHVQPAAEFSGRYLLEAVPEVGDMDHARYGTVLGVGPFDMMSDRPDRLHIWHLFEDPPVVYNLVKKGLSYWGQYRSFRSAGGQVEGIDTEAIDTVTSKIAVFERFQELYQKGRSRRIDRQVLEGSGIISPAFVDAVAEKSAELNNDPEALLDALDNGAVPRFQSRTIERLREYLIDKEYLSEEPPLSAEEIWVQLSAFISRLKVNLEDVQRFIDRILRS